MEPDVVEIAPPLASCSKTRTVQKAIITQEVIDVEEYEMQNGNNNKGKAIQFGSYSHDDEQYEMQNGSVLDDNNNNNKGKHIEFDSPSYDEQQFAVNGSDSLLDPDSLIYEEDFEYADMNDYDMVGEEVTDSYSMYQDLFDSKDVPTGVEMSMDWFGKEMVKPKNETSSSSSKTATIQSQGIFFQPYVGQPWNVLSQNSKGVVPSSAYSLPPQNTQPIQYPPSPFSFGFSTSTTMKHYPVQFQPQHQTPLIGQSLGVGMTPVDATTGLMLPVPKNRFHLVSSRPRVEDVISANDSSRAKKNMEDFLGTYLFFKRFDIVEDCSDHQYASLGTTSKQHSKEWAKRIQEEWRILENDLPEMIFVRAYESRMDLLRAVIIGAEGTPYHDGLFFFDIFFPDTYPSVPPSVHYHSGGLRINPNLYNSGKVCLSLLGTWSGRNSKEKWIPNDSTMLQVLVSIQGLILNQKPYFNEPGHERTEGTPMGEISSKAYSENTFLLSLKTMVYNMRRPPKHFEDFAYGHFFTCAHDVLKACNAYKSGAPVGSLVKGGVQDLEESSSQISSLNFRNDVAFFVESLLLKEFILLGVQGLEAEGENKASETNAARSSSKRDRVESPFYLI